MRNADSLALSQQARLDDAPVAGAVRRLPVPMARRMGRRKAVHQARSVLPLAHPDWTIERNDVLSLFALALMAGGVMVLVEAFPL